VLGAGFCIFVCALRTLLLYHPSIGLAMAARRTILTRAPMSTRKRAVSAKRKYILDTTRTALLTQSRRRCCLCFCLLGDFNEKAGQIAHLDRDPSNAAFENLVWLCLEHHDRYDSVTSQSKGLTADEVAVYRDQLYGAVKQRFSGVSEEQTTVTNSTAQSSPSAFSDGVIASRPGPLKDFHIVTVTDNLKSGRALAEQLYSAGAAIVEREISAERAKSLLNGVAPNMVIMSHKLVGEATGTDLAQWMCQQPHLQRTLRVSLSSAPPTTVVQNIDSLFHAVITQPISESRLIDDLSMLVQNQQSLNWLSRDNMQVKTIIVLAYYDIDVLRSFTQLYKLMLSKYDFVGFLNGKEVLKYCETYPVRIISIGRGSPACSPSAVPAV